MGKMKEKFIELQNEQRGQPIVMSPEQIRGYLRQQVKWYTEGKISEQNLRFKIDDTRTRYPNVIDYGIEMKLMLVEMKEELYTLKNITGVKTNEL